MFLKLYTTWTKFLFNKNSAYAELVRKHKWKTARVLACTCKLFAQEMAPIVRFLRPRAKMPKTHIRWMALRAPPLIREILLKNTTRSESVVLTTNIANLLENIDDKIKFETGCQSLGINLERVMLENRWVVKASDGHASTELHRAFLFAIEVDFWPALRTFYKDTFQVTDAYILNRHHTEFGDDVFYKAIKMPGFQRELYDIWCIISTRWRRIKD